MDIHTHIKQLLDAAGWTKVMLAKELGVSPQALSRFLLKKKHSSLIIKLMPYITGEKILPKVERKKRIKISEK